MTQKSCPKCNGVAHWDSYFKAWICSRFACNYFSREDKPEQYMTEIELHEKKYHSEVSL